MMPAPKALLPAPDPDPAHDPGFAAGGERAARALAELPPAALARHSTSAGTRSGSAPRRGPIRQSSREASSIQGGRAAPRTGFAITRASFPSSRWTRATTRFRGGDRGALGRAHAAEPRVSPQAAPAAHRPAERGGAPSGRRHRDAARQAARGVARLREGPSAGSERRDLGALARGARASAQGGEARRRAAAAPAVVPPQPAEQGSHRRIGDAPRRRWSHRRVSEPDVVRKRQVSRGAVDA